MKILIISPAPPNLFHRMRLHTTIKALMVDHQITLASLAIDSTHFNKNEYPKIKYYPVRKSKVQCYIDSAKGVFTTNPLEVAYCASKELKILCNDLVNKHDLVLVKRLRAFQYLPKQITVPVILDTTDAMSLFYKRGIKNVNICKKPLFIEEYLKYKNYEVEVSKKVKEWIVCAQDDIKYLRKLLGNKINLFHIPNVVDTDYFKQKKSQETSDLVFTGLMDKPINYLSIIDFIEKILPEIKRDYPKLSLKVIGPKPPEKLKQLESSNVEVVGKVEDLRPYINGAKVVIAPIVFGTGSSFKVTQAWSHAKPVVCNSVGARGLIYKNGHNIFVTDDKKDFAEKVKILLSNKSLANSMGKSGRRNVLKHYSIETMRKKYNYLIKRIV